MRKVFAIAFPVMFLLLALILGACTRSQAPAQTGATIPGEAVQTAKGTYTNIDVKQLKPLLDDPRFFVVNVHIPYAGEIPGTDALVPFNEVAQQISAFPADKAAPIVIYCRSGSMSAQASKTLVELGYTQVYNVTGGMNAWQAAGYELVQR